MTKGLKKFWNVFSWALIAIIVVLAILLAGVRLVGLRPFMVLSGSMEPTYHVGALIYVKPCDPADVKVGDAITFVLDENLTVATHRVVSIDAANQYFYTKGDANNASDGAPVYFKNLIGRPVFTIPYLGYVSNWITNPPGMYITITAAAVFVILLFLPDAVRKADEADKRKERAETEKNDRNDE
jgi:signal peptidase